MNLQNATNAKRITRYLDLFTERLEQLFADGNILPGEGLMSVAHYIPQNSSDYGWKAAIFSSVFVCLFVCLLTNIV